MTVRVYGYTENVEKRCDKSRVQVPTEAVAGDLKRQASDQITAAMDAVCEQLEGSNDGNDRFVSSAARRVLERTEW